MKSRNHDPSRRNGQSSAPLEVQIELEPTDLRNSPRDLGRLVDELLPLAEARVGEALAARHWEEWWGRLHGAGVQANPPAGGRATFAMRHWQVFAGTLSDSERGKLRASLLAALQVQFQPTQGAALNDAAGIESEDDGSTRQPPANERLVIIRRVDAPAGLVNDPHHDRQTDVQDA